jgi:4-hydroxy-3-methylbut-2-enyl diphosphate reductase
MVGHGEVLVATEIGDSVHGLLPCPAAPLVGGLLRRKGMRVRYAPVPQSGDASQSDEGGATLFVTAALHRDGTSTAIGAAVDGVDGVTRAAARAAVEEWSAVTGTRRLISAESPWCRGARAALDRVRQVVAASDQTVHVYGPMACSPQDRADLEKNGAVFIGSLTEVPDGGTVVFPAHGAPVATREAATERGLDVIDATCDLAAGVHDEVRRFIERGDQVVVIGHAGHAVTPVLLAEAPGRTTLVESPAGAGAVQVADPRRVSYVLEPGIAVEDARAPADALRSRFPALRPPNPDRFCYAASDRAETVRTMAASCDVVLVLGAEDDPDTRFLAGLIRSQHAKAHVVAEVSQIVPSWLISTSAVGIAESTCARPGLAAELAEALSGLGPLSVTQRRVSTVVTGRPV